MSMEGVRVRHMQHCNRAVGVSLTLMMAPLRSSKRQRTGDCVCAMAHISTNITEGIDKLFPEISMSAGCAVGVGPRDDAFVTIWT
jgi:hypothetical protein